MSRELDDLIAEARRAEDPRSEDRQGVRRALEQRLLSGAAPPDIDGEPLPAPAAPLLGPGALKAAGVLLLGGGLALLATQRGSDVVAARGPAPSIARGPLDATPMRETPQSSRAAPSGLAPEGSPEPARAEPLLEHVAPPQPAGDGAGVPPREVPPRPRRKPGAARPKPQPAETTPAPPTLEAESRALARVQRALDAGQHEAALSLLDVDDRAFARGVLGQERAAARVIALCGAGRLDLARKRTRDFIARYPESPLAARVLSSCEGRASGEAAP